MRSQEILKLAYILHILIATIYLSEKIISGRSLKLECGVVNKYFPCSPEEIMEDII